ncbi:putative ammonia-lyase, Serine racemase [Helianthus annuus]|nr:putative ammonia-lyase, Serine racemase [Helianthus annuus]
MLHIQRFLIFFSYSGQGTLSLEFLDQKPVGGGLTSGILIGAKAKNPAIRVFVAEPKGADDAAQSKACGRLITLSQTNTIVDGLRASLGNLTWPVIRDLVDAVITVEDDFKKNPMSSCSQNVWIVLSGGNADLDVLFESWKNL